MRFGDEDESGPAVGRRGFLTFGLAALAAVALPPALLSPSSAEAAPLLGASVRRLALHNVNTGEHFNDVYWANGAYRPEALRKLNVLLRDYKAHQVCRQDPRLFDVLWQVHQMLESSEPYQVLCGYRSRKTNALARRRSRGVAKESYHTRGMAVDVVLPDRSLKGVMQQAMALQAGGVGYYPRSGFVHMDVGPVRHW
ncbi:MAG TPA: DUF882 domain-containing protein [Azospirillum sp.]|nr:DUF882 domain-containing protein [Azospirillum sp.]